MTLEPGKVLERTIAGMLSGAIALMIRRGIPGDLALEVFDEFVVSAYTSLEIELQQDMVLNLDGPIGLLMTDEGRAQILQAAQVCVARQAQGFGE